VKSDYLKILLKKIMAFAGISNIFSANLVLIFS
jgi:hypothetical protein